MDFRYLLDLYTLTFDEDETVDEIKVHTLLPSGEVKYVHFGLPLCLIEKYN